MTTKHACVNMVLLYSILYIIMYSTFIGGAEVPFSELVDKSDNWCVGGAGRGGGG